MEFRKNGYKVMEDYQVLNAVDHGVPKTGNVSFSWGRAKVFRCPNILSPPTNAEPARAEAGNLFRRSTPTVWDALRDFPEADDYEELLHRDWVKAKFKKPTDYSAPLRGEEADPGRLLRSSRVRREPAYVESANRSYGSLQENVPRNAARRHRTCQPLSQARSQGRLQHDSRRHRQ